MPLKKVRCGFSPDERAIANVTRKIPLEERPITGTSGMQRHAVVENSSKIYFSTVIQTVKVTIAAEISRSVTNGGEYDSYP